MALWSLRGRVGPLIARDKSACRGNPLLGHADRGTYMRRPRRAALNKRPEANLIFNRMEC